MNLDVAIQLAEPYLPPRPKRFAFGLANKLVAQLEQARGLSDAYRLRKDYPTLRSLHKDLPKSRDVLKRAHADYVSAISSPKIAISLELAAFLVEFCTRIRPRRIADLGSGFSSFVFRTCLARMPSCVVYTVDDSEEWLARTKSFLEAHRLSTDFLFTWKDFEANETGTFDLVLHDLGDFRTRSRTLGRVLTRLTPTGFVVLDDMHKLSYNISAKRILRSRSLMHYSLEAFTLDIYGRFSELVVGNGA